MTTADVQRLETERLRPMPPDPARLDPNQHLIGFGHGIGHLLVNHLLAPVVHDLRPHHDDSLAKTCGL